uniref:Ycf17 n=1 Tax=Pterocladia lucida TaxID=31408 RepID=A0A6M3WWM5_PTELU|nr:Ycf17 [Pterocladia lucida]
MCRNRWIWGFSVGAESWNGRLAMVSFVMIFLIELYFSKSVLKLIGVY